MSSSKIDTNLLRASVRMVHCMQKERGSSCAYYADDSSKVFELAMMDARKKTDIAASLIPHKDLPRLLQKIRSFLEENKKKKEDSADSTVLHRLFVSFNTLISSVIHECILQPLGRHHKTTVKKYRRHNRGLSADINDRLSSELVASPEYYSLHKSETDPIRSAAETRRLRTLYSIGSEDEGDGSGINPPPPPPVSSSDLETALQIKPSVSAASHPFFSGPPSKKVVNFSSSESRIEELIDLLHTFVQLKESAGIERALLMSSIVARKTKDESFRMLTNDLILQVENQRSLVNQLENLPSGQHRNIVLDLAQLSPKLRELHNVILSDFDSLQEQEYNAASLWEMITLYIDKLHSVELLIIEELECSPMSASSPIIDNSIQSSGRKIEVTQQSPEISDQSLATTNVLQGIFTQPGKSDLISLLESMSAENIKKRLLEVLAGKREAASHAQSASSPVDKVDQHHNGAIASLNEGLNDALNNTVVGEEPTSTEWEVSIYEIKFTRRIGQGASATTYLANWTGQDVAVKVASTTRFGLEGWRTEAAALRKLHHPNIIRLMGSIYHKNPLTYCLVLEYCNAGDLNTALKYPTPKNFFFHVSISITNAMTYLHTRKIIHRDLKPQNVLCHGNIASGNFTVKVTDFGVATEAQLSRSENESVGSVASSSAGLTGETGTYRWMAPEVVRHEAYSTKADVYSFAVMVWQFLTHEEPFCDDSAIDAARRAAIEKERPPIPKGTPASVAELITSNWSDKPGDRWKFETLCETLKKIQNTLSASEREFLEEPYGHPVYVYEEPEIESDTESCKKKNGKNGKHAMSLLSHFFGSQKKAGKR